MTIVEKADKRSEKPAGSKPNKNTPEIIKKQKSIVKYREVNF